MSAINPASFVTPTASLGVPNAFGPGTMAGGGQESPSSRRRQFGLGLSHTAQPGFDEAPESPQNYAAVQGAGLRNPYFNPYQRMGAGLGQPAHSMSAYQQILQPSTEPFAPHMTGPYHMLNPAASSFATSQNPSGRTGRRNQSPVNDWTGNFQGLSLGS